MNNTLSNGSGGRLPDLGAYGLRWKEAQKLAEECDRLWQAMKQAGQEQLVLGERIKTLEREFSEARARALRGAEEPDEKPLLEAREKLEASRQRILDLRRAAEYAKADLLQVVAEGRSEWSGKVQEKGAKALDEAARAAAVLSEKLAAADEWASIYKWLESGGSQYTTASPAGVSIEHLLHERRRELGLLEVVG